MLFTQACTLYLKQSKIRHAEATRKQAIGYLRRACEYLGEYECEEIDRTLFLDFIIHRKELNPEISNATLNKYLRYTKSVLRDEANIILNFKKLRIEKKLPQVLSEVTIRKVYKYLEKYDIEEHKRNKLMFMMLLDTGLRISELLSIRVEDISFTNLMIYVSKTKSKVHRYVLFTRNTANELEKFIKINRIEKHIFINLESRKVLHPDSIQTICQRIQEKANIQKSITPHKWRHTFATNFNDNNGNLFVLQKLMGHANITSTQTYVTVSTKKIIEEYTRIVENSVK